MEKPMSAEDFKRIEKLMAKRNYAAVIGSEEDRHEIHMELADEVPQLLAEVRYQQRRWAKLFHCPNHGILVPERGDYCTSPECKEARAILSGEKP